MKSSIILLTLVISISAIAQRPRVNWGPEFKFQGGGNSFKVILTDNTGIYIQETHIASKGFMIALPGSDVFRLSGTLVKLEKNMAERYRNNFDKELKGREFLNLFVFKEKIFLAATAYDKREKMVNLEMGEIDKNTGVVGDWKTISSFPMDDKKDVVGIRLKGNSDSTRMIVVSVVQGKERNTYSVQEFDNMLNAVSTKTTISNEFEPKTYVLEDVVYTRARKIVLVGRVFEYREGKKKSDKYLDFVNYNIRLYDENGKQQKEINTEASGQWVTSAKLIQEEGHDIVFAAFYAKTKKGYTIDGMLLHRLDPATGELLASFNKEINHSMLTDADNTQGETPEEKKERERFEKRKDNSEGFSNLMTFRNIIHTKDGGLLIMAEDFRRYYITYDSYNSLRKRYEMRTDLIFKSGAILISKISAAGEWEWMQIVPKFQQEEYTVSSFLDETKYSLNRPFFDNHPSSDPGYSGFGLMQTDKNIHLIFNDNPRNATITKPGSKVRRTIFFKDSHCYAITLDQKTGEIKRTMLFDNNNTPIAMPIHSSVIGNVLYVVGRDDRGLAKPRIAVAKIQFTN